ncbi:MAG TPA: DUF3597 domain-containing protein [Gammaproteobacteria bacterium]|nr:DUF3597 domain-containing protein [Gammaproteobacteria bacterium]
MGMFSGIMEKLGFNKSAQQAAAASLTAGSPQGAPPGAAPAAPTASPTASTSPPPTTAQPAPTAMSTVDVMGQLEKLAASNPQKLNWRTSIVDMLKLLGMDSSLTARKNLAVELGCPADKLADSAQMNTWLHRQVLEKLAQNGGNVPKDLLH